MALNVQTIGVTAILNGLAAAVASGGGSATLQLLDGGSGVVATVTLPNPEFTVGSTTAKLNGTPLASSNAASSAMLTGFSIKDRAGNVVLTGAISLTGDLYSVHINQTAGVPIQLNDLYLLADASGALTLRGSISVS